MIQNYFVYTERDAELNVPDYAYVNFVEEVGNDLCGEKDCYEISVQLSDVQTFEQWCDTNENVIYYEQM